MVEYFVIRSRDFISQSGDSTHGGKTTHPKLPSAQPLSWSLDDFEEKIKTFQSDFNSLVSNKFIKINLSQSITFK